MKIIVQHDPNWKTEFEREKSRIAIALGSAAHAIHHIGSTSIPDIFAKPIIDILVETKDLEKIDQRNEPMNHLGYEAMGRYGIDGRRYFRRTVEGVRTHHIHVFQVGSAQAIRHLAFRDYLLAHPGIAKKYSDLKAKLLIEEKRIIEDYMDKKDPFIRETEKEAVQWYHTKKRS